MKEEIILDTSSETLPGLVSEQIEAFDAFFQSDAWRNNTELENALNQFVNTYFIPPLCTQWFGKDIEELHPQLTLNRVANAIETNTTETTTTSYSDEVKINEEMEKQEEVTTPRIGGATSLERWSISIDNFPEIFDPDDAALKLSLVNTVAHECTHMAQQFCVLATVNKNHDIIKEFVPQEWDCTELLRNNKLPLFDEARPPHENEMLAAKEMAPYLVHPVPTEAGMQPFKRRDIDSSTISSTREIFENNRIPAIQYSAKELGALDTTTQALTAKLPFKAAQAYLTPGDNTAAGKYCNFMENIQTKLSAERMRVKKFLYHSQPTELEAFQAGDNFENLYATHSKTPLPTRSISSLEESFCAVHKAYNQKLGHLKQDIAIAPQKNIKNLQLGEKLENLCFSDITFNNSSKTLSKETKREAQSVLRKGMNRILSSSKSSKKEKKKAEEKETTKKKKRFIF